MPPLLLVSARPDVNLDSSAVFVEGSKTGDHGLTLTMPLYQKSSNRTLQASIRIQTSMNHYQKTYIFSTKKIQRMSCAGLKSRSWTTACMGGTGIHTSAKEDGGFANILTGDTKLSKKW